MTGHAHIYSSQSEKTTTISTGKVIQKIKAAMTETRSHQTFGKWSKYALGIECIPILLYL